VFTFWKYRVILLESDIKIIHNVQRKRKSAQNPYLNASEVGRRADCMLVRG